MSKDRDDRVRMAVGGLSLSDAGGAIPFGISDLGGGASPNAFEWTVSVLFGATVLALVAALLWRRKWLAPAALASAGLWTVAALHMAINGDLDTLARLGLGLIFAGIAASCVGLGLRFHAEHRRAAPAEPMAGPPHSDVLDIRDEP